MNIKSIIILIVFVSSVLGLRAQERYQVSQGVISFYSSAPLEDIYAVNNKVRSLIDLSTLEFAFVVPIPGFEFRKSLMQSHFNERYLESNKYPNATFIGKLVGESVTEKSGTKKIVAEGEIKIHGVAKMMAIPATIIFEDDKLIVESEFILKPKDFKIKIPRILIKNIAEEVLVKVNLVYE